MFKIVAAPMAWWPVTFAGVSEEGEVFEHKFEMRFRILDEDENIAFIKECTAAEGLVLSDEEVSAPSQVSRDLVKRIAVDWREVAAENGEAIKFDDEHLAQLLKVPNVFLAVLSAYRDCRGARPRQRTGN